MNILTISGSSRPMSTNISLLESLCSRFPDHNFTRFCELYDLPVFQAISDMSPWHKEVVRFRKMIAESDAVVISTPEYIHNIPGQLKNALDWLASSGELVGKPVFVITYMPYHPRGEYAMKSLLWSLDALDARVVASLDLYQENLSIKDGEIFADDDTIGMIQEAIAML